MTDNYDNKQKSKAGYLKYKTIGQITPQGLPKILFACHPKEFERYFETVWQWLREGRNVALFYESPEEVLTWDRLRDDLYEIQLIVMPVTTKLLMDKCRATEEILPFANENHIPVLPIMMEEKLEELFTPVFGKIQYLSATGNDPTKISFEVKLAQFLDNVLVGDETAKKIRDAFDAYIFLSYRKKDRAFAQELMKMIHSHERYRDIAIWYDEYLVPGEKYNDAIENALQTSDLFTLVVTPALLERHAGEPNYIMKYEYPHAVAAKKPILPVEMAETRKPELKKEFAGLPECVQKENGENLDRSILEKLHDIALRKNDDPLHNYFIGLAYLDGIDVEIDSERAIRLITEAAEGGLEEAVRKLIAIYHDGKGVQRDYMASLQWRFTLVEMIQDRRRAILKEGRKVSDEINFLMVHELEELGDAYAEVGQLEAAEETYEEMADFIGLLSYQSTYTSVRKKTEDLLIQGYSKLGDIFFKMDLPFHAEEWYRKVFDLIDEKQMSENVQGLILLWNLYNRLGDALLYNSSKRKRITEVRSQAEKEHNFQVYYKKAKEIGRKIAYMDSSLPMKRYWLISSRKTGEAEQVVSGMEEIAAETQSIDDRRELSYFYNNIGAKKHITAIARGEMEYMQEAANYLNKALIIRKAIAEETETIQSYIELANIYENVGMQEKRTGNGERAIECLQAAVALREKISKATESTDSQVELARALDILATVGDTSGLPQALEIWDDLIRKEPYNRVYLTLRKEILEVMEGIRPLTARLMLKRPRMDWF